MKHVYLLFCVSAIVWGQIPRVPIITSVQNAATMTGRATPVIAPQMLVAIIGMNLATSATTASLPWPPQLGGTSVTFNGTPAALYFVSATQINAEVPSALQGSSNATIIVNTPAGASAPVAVTVATSAIGIFTQDMTGCGPLAAFNIHADGSLSLNTPQSSLDPVKDYGLAIWLTGIGAFADRIDGVPWQFNAADNHSRSGPSLSLGIPNVPNVPSDVVTSSFEGGFEITYAGPAPGLSGVDQVNATIPSLIVGLPLFPNQLPRLPEFQACHVPLYLTDNTTSASQVVSISIHNGGGTCVDPTPTGLAAVTWQKSFVSDTSGSSSSDGVAAIFLQGYGIGFVEAGPNDRAFSYSASLPQPSVCSASYPATVDEGPLAFSGAGNSPITLTAMSLGGITSYAAALPAGTITGGSYQVSGSGFSDTEAIPPPITITTNLQPGTNVPSNLTVSWNGGDMQSGVTVQFRVLKPGSTAPAFIASQTVYASVGAVSFPGAYCEPLSQSSSCSPDLPPPSNPFPYPTGNVEVIVTQQRGLTPPYYELFPPFALPGFSIGGEQDWNYTWDFRGLSSH